MRTVNLVSALLAVLCLILCTQDQSTNPDYTTVVPHILWKKGGIQSLPTGVDSVRISISSSSLTGTTSQIFAFGDKQGTFRTLPAGIGVTVLVEGVDSSGQVLYSGTVVVPRLIAPSMEITIEANQVTPLVPTNLAAQALSYNSIRLVWTVNSTNQDGFIVYRFNGTTQRYDSIGVTTQNVYTDSGLQSSTQYRYTVRAANAAGKSPNSVTGQTTTQLYDNTPPLLTITSHNSVDTVNSRTITLYGTVSDTSGIYQLLVNDVLVQPSGTNWMKQGFYLSDIVNTITIRATDNSSLRNQTQEILTIYYMATYVDTSNNRPVFTISSDSLRSTIKVGHTYRKLLKAFDPDSGDSLRFTVRSPLSLLGKDTITWTPSKADTGANSFYALVFDKKNAKDSLGWTITVLDSAQPVPNSPPRFTTSLNEITDTITLGTQYRDTLHAQDDNTGQKLRFSIVTGTTGLSIDTMSGIISWQPTTKGTVGITARVTDDSGAYASLAWTITVLDTTSNGLVAYYPFSGDANDASGNGLDGVVSGATLTPDRLAQANKAYTFNASSMSRITVQDNLLRLDNDSALSVSVWLKIPFVQPDKGLIGKGTDLDWSTGKGWAMSTGANGSIGFNLGNGTTMIGTHTRSSYSDGRWHHIVATWSKGNIDLYVDGVVREYLNGYQGNVSSHVVSTAQMRFGDYAYHTLNDRLLTGALDDIRIYKSKLSSSEINSIYHEDGWVRSAEREFTLDANTVGLWHFNEGYGTTSGDATGNDNNCLFYGSPTWASGIVGSALHLDGPGNGSCANHDDAYIPPTTNLLNLHTPFTVELCFKPDTLNPGTYYEILSNNDYSKGAGYLIRLDTKDTDSLFFFGQKGTGSVNFKVGCPISYVCLGSWQYLAVTYTGSVLRFYLNAALLDSQTITDTIPRSDFNLTFGNAPGGCFTFNGSIDEIRFSDVSRPESAISAYWNSN